MTKDVVASRFLLLFEYFWWTSIVNLNFHPFWRGLGRVNLGWGRTIIYFVKVFYTESFWALEALLLVLVGGGNLAFFDGPEEALAGHLADHLHLRVIDTVAELAEGKLAATIGDPIERVMMCLCHRHYWAFEWFLLRRSQVIDVVLGYVRDVDEILGSLFVTVCQLEKALTLGYRRHVTALLFFICVLLRGNFSRYKSNELVTVIHFELKKVNLNFI